MTHPRDDLHAELATLRNENADLRERARALERERDSISWRYDMLRLSPQQKRLLTRLYLSAPGIVTNDRLHSAMSADGFAETQINHLKVVLCTVRKKLRPFGVSITCHWAVGYSISASDKAKLKELVSGS